MGPEKTISAIREYIAAFLDTHLRGMAPDAARELLLTGPSSEYPDAVVVTGQERLCAKP
jgi:hypothetical protein